MDYKEHLRRLAVHDDALVDMTLSRGRTGRCPSSTRGPRHSCGSRRRSPLRRRRRPFQHAVALALAAGASNDGLVATLEAVTPVLGAARVVHSAPMIALALGYDVEAALEEERYVLTARPARHPGTWSGPARKRTRMGRCARRMPVSCHRGECKPRDDT